MKTFYFTILAIILFAGSAIADSKITGHMPPLPDEILETPIHLNCGVTIREWRGYPHNELKANELCNKALAHFEPFLNKRGINLKHHKPVEWNMALLPRGNSYRALNDLKWRFRYRTSQFPIWGYTDIRFQYVFMLGDSNHYEFDVTFVHELFHTFSMWYGVFDSHSNTWNEKVLADEALAEEFTAELGYGR